MSRAGRILLGLALAVAVAVALAAAPFFLVRQGMLRQWALDRSGVARLLGPGQRVAIQHVERLDPSGLSLVGVELQRREEGAWKPWLRVDQFKADWRLPLLLRKEIVVSGVDVAGVVFDFSRIPRADTSGAAAPASPSRPPGNRRVKLPRILCDSLGVNGIQVRGLAGREVDGDIVLRELRHDAGALSGRLSHARVRLQPDSLELLLGPAALAGGVDGLFQIDSLAVRGPGTELRVSAEYARVEPGRTMFGAAAREEEKGARREDAPALAGIAKARSESDGDSPEESDGALGQDDGDGHGESAAAISASIEVLRCQPSILFAALGRGAGEALPLREEDALAGLIRLHGELVAGDPPEIAAELDLQGRFCGLPLDSLFAVATGSPRQAVLDALILRSGVLRLRAHGEWSHREAARAHLRFAGLDLSGEALRLWTDDLPSSDLAGTLEGDIQFPALRARVSLQVEPGLLAGRAVSGFEAEAEYAPPEIRLHDLRTSEPVPMVQVSGRLSLQDRSISAEGALARFPLEEWVSPAIRVPMEGLVSGPFSLQGSLRSPRLSASLGTGPGRVEEVRIDTLTADFRSGSLRPLDLRGELSARGLDIYGIGLDSVRGPVRLADTISADFVGWRDTTRVDLHTRVIPRSVGAVFIDSVLIQPGSAPRVWLGQPSRLDFSSREVRCDSITLVSSAGRLAGSGWIFPHPLDDQERFGFSVAAQEVDVGRVASFLQPGTSSGGGITPAPFQGTADVVVTGSGTVGVPRMSYRLDVAAAEVFGWTWEQISASGFAGGDPPGEGNDGVVRSVLRVDSLVAAGSGYLARGPGGGRLEPAPPGQRFRVEARNVEVANPGRWEDFVEGLADSLWSVLGASSIAAEIEARAVPLPPLLSPVLSERAIRRSATVAALRPARDPLASLIRVVRPEQAQSRAAQRSGIGGRADVRLSLGGTASEPRARVEVAARDVQIHQAWADSVVLSAGYQDGVASVENLAWHMGPKRFTSSGSLALRLTVPPERSGLLPRPVALTAELPEIDLAIASLVTNQIEDPVGLLDGRISLSGIPPRVYPEGELRIQDGSFRIPGREDRLTGVQADLMLDSTGIHFRDVRGSLNGQGTVTLGGRYRNPSDFHLEAAVRRGMVYESGAYRFVVDGDLTAAPIPEGDTLRPRVSGNVEVLEGLITIDLAQPPGSSLPPYTPWLVDLRVIAPGNFQVNQPATTVDLGEGDIAITFRWPYWNLSGDVQVLDGRYRIFNHAFRITSGTVEFEDTGRGPKAILDVEAEITVPGVNTDEPVQVVIHVAGTPGTEDLQVSVSSPNRPDYTQAQLIELLSVGQLGVGALASSQSRVGTFSRGDPTRQYLGTELLGQVERQLVSYLPMADRVQILGEIGGAEPLWINLRPIVRPQWSVNYAQELSDDPGREVGVRYRLSNLLFLTGSFERRLTGLEGVPRDNYSLDLKVRVEY